MAAKAKGEELGEVEEEEEEEEDPDDHWGEEEVVVRVGESEAEIPTFALY